jgi:hypothetical protein
MPAQQISSGSAPMSLSSRVQLLCCWQEQYDDEDDLFYCAATPADVLVVGGLSAYDEQVDHQ